MEMKIIPITDKQTEMTRNNKKFNSLENTENETKLWKMKINFTFAFAQVQLET